MVFWGQQQVLAVCAAVAAVLAEDEIEGPVWQRHGVPFHPLDGGARRRSETVREAEVVSQTAL
jgi:hypothetical protein